MRTRPTLINPYDRSATANLLTDSYPQIYRLSAALTGDEAVAASLSREVLRRSLLQLHRWYDPGDPQRWFPHMAVLLARELRPLAGPVLRAESTGALSVISAATAPLSMQQREALLLHYGEHFDPRQMASAMDCSATAASNHLAAAVQRLRPLAGDGLDNFLLALPQMLASLVPPPGEIVLRVERQIRQSRWAARLRRALKWLVAFAVLAAAAAVAIHARALLAS